MAEIAGSYDIVVVGAGMAGASVASELAGEGRSVALIEREAQPGYHSTGRSAALFSEIYGPPQIRALSRASGPFFRETPAGFSEHRLLSPRGVMMIGRADQVDALDRMEHELGGFEGVQRLDGDETRQRLPLLREGYAAGAVYEPHASDIDVHAVHHGFLRRYRAAGGVFLANAELLGLSRDGGDWLIETRAGVLRAASVVNAAGAWADEIGAMAGAAPVGLTPKRRTALIVAAPEGRSIEGWSMAVDIEEDFYLKPDAGRLLISPADETPMPPCDVQPDEMDIAICVDRIETAFDLSVRHIENKWAGLRSFVADKTPVAGYDPAVPGFFWLAGQGGYGIQTAPALARTSAALVLGRAIPKDIADKGVSEAALAPSRLRQAA